MTDAQIITWYTTQHANELLTLFNRKFMSTTSARTIRYLAAAWLGISLGHPILDDDRLAPWKYGKLAVSRLTARSAEELGLNNNYKNQDFLDPFLSMGNLVSQFHHNPTYQQQQHFPAYCDAIRDVTDTHTSPVIFDKKCLLCRSDDHKTSDHKDIYTLVDSIRAEDAVTTDAITISVLLDALKEAGCNDTYLLAHFDPKGKICPLCHGDGKVETTGDAPGFGEGATVTFRATCHCCSGTKRIHPYTHYNKACWGIRRLRSMIVGVANE